MRTEQEIFSDLAAICIKPGYIHAIAYLCFRNYIPHRPKLIRTEINTLLGLTIKSDIDWSIPAPKSLQEYVDTTDKLLRDLHQCLLEQPLKTTAKSSAQDDFNPFKQGDVLREPIFYSGDSAYMFQYLDLAKRKYAADSEWLQKNCGFTIDQVTPIAKAIESIHNDNLIKIRNQLINQDPNKWTTLHVFSFTLEDIAAKTKLTTEIVGQALGAFQTLSTERNSEFNSLNDFNVITTKPLLRMPSGELILLQVYSFAESIYEAPFYWMNQDSSYKAKLSKNRGDFTEKFVANRLEQVFGKDHVHLNVDIYKTRSERVSDIDVLVIWGNRVIIAQTKSKRLTINSRKGNDLNIRKDFEKAIQNAYDQGATCAKILIKNECRLVASDGREVVLPDDIKEIYILCVISDHYPALSFQSQQFLKTESIDRTLEPLVMDVFAVDVMTEMLQSPLQLLSYINRRASHSGRLMASQELTILGYHLANNLWVQPDVNLAYITDDFSAELDIAMTVRRTGIQGITTPSGILTRFAKTTIGRIVKEIEYRPTSETIDLGFLLLAMNEQAVTEMSHAVNKLAARVRADGKAHDVTFMSKEDSGITFLCTNEPDILACDRLRSYCTLRKYREKASQWFGLCISSTGSDVRFGISLVFPWNQDEQMDQKTRDMKPPIPIYQVLQELAMRRGRKSKIGRNDPCPCGSGHKYKKCCLNLC